MGIDERAGARGLHLITVVHDSGAKRLPSATEHRDHQAVPVLAAMPEEPARAFALHSRDDWAKQSRQHYPTANSRMKCDVDHI